MLYAKPAWKENWESTRAHFIDWWNHKGPILRLSDLPSLARARDNVAPPPKAKDAIQWNTDPVWFARNQRAMQAKMAFPADNLPIAYTDYGCVQLAACLGAEPGFEEYTVWYAECIADPEKWPPLVLTKTERWWQTYRAVMLEVQRISGGDFLVGMPAFGSNLDVLAALRGTQNLLCDLIDRPDWVKAKLEEINRAFFTAFDDYYEQIRLLDGSSAYSYFSLWGPGKVSQVQCDFAAMISPEIFAEFVVPPLRRQCAWLDHSLFHLDGPNCICHLDLLLAIPELDVVQWTPGAGQPEGGNEKWYDLYARILKAGKSAQIYTASAEGARRLFDTFGAAGLYVSANIASQKEAEELIAFVDARRK